MTTNKAINKAIAIVAIALLIVGGEGARRPKLNTRPTATATVLIV